MALLRTAERTAVSAAPRTSRLGRDFWLGYALTLPAFVVVVGLVAYPLGYAFWLSLQDIKVGGQGQFIGLGNYARLLLDSESRIYGLFWNSVKVTALYTAGRTGRQVHHRYDQCYYSAFTDTGSPFLANSLVHTLGHSSSGICVHLEMDLQ